MNKIKAIIFDMDGLLIDSMVYWIEEDHKYLAKHGLVLTEDMIKYFTGRSEIENMTWLIEEHGLVGEVEDLLAERNDDIDLIYTEKTNLMPGVLTLINKIKQAGLKQAIATGAPSRHLKLVIDRFQWHDHFESFISSEHVESIGKPDPRIFLHAAKELGIEPENCVVFEDAENGVEAAKRAGMKCIAVPDSRWSFGDFSRADLVVSSLEDEKILEFLKIE